LWGLRRPWHVLHSTRTGPRCADGYPGRTIVTPVLVERLRTLGVPVMNERALAQEKSLKMIRELTGALLQESGVGMGVIPAISTRRVRSSMTIRT